MKMGNYGTGRSYTYRRVVNNSGGGGRSGSKQDPACCYIIMLIILSGMFMYSAYIEYDTNQKIYAVNHIADNVNPNIPYGSAGIEYINNYNIQNQDVFLQDVPINSEPIIDNEFGFMFKQKLGAKRRAEFCQWQEYRHENTRNIGTDAQNNTIQEVTVSYSYQLGWHSRPINSLFFDASISYHNPQRDPIPNKDYATTLWLDNQIKVDSSLLMDSPTSKFTQFYIPYNGDVGDYAYQQGFQTTSQDGKWAYSKYQEDYNIAKKAAGFMFEGIIDLGIQGKCTPGDVRVTWETIDLPETYSVIGHYSQNRLEAIQTLNNKNMVLGLNGSNSISLIQHFYSEQIFSYRFWSRIQFLVTLTICTLIFIFTGGYDKYLINSNTDNSNLKAKDI